MTERGGVSRRALVKAGALALVSFGLDPLVLERAASTAFRPAAPSSSRRILVVLFQRGGADGLSMVVPHGDSFYYRERPRIAIPRADLLDLDGHFGLHPALEALRPLWENGSLAVIHAAGSPHATRNHFDAQDFVETGTTGMNSTADGWLNRFCHHDCRHECTAFRAVAFGPRLPRILAGSAPALAIDDLPVDGFAAVERLQRADPTRNAAANGADYPAGRLGRSLLRIAQLIKADLGLQIAVADASGWDTHVNQGAAAGQLALRLREMGQALAAFTRDLGERMREVVVLTLSEFGRTVRENGNAGTDHGHGTALFAIGGPVNGGKVLGRWPGLDPAHRFEGRDLAVTTDFRDLVGEVLHRHLGVRDLAPLFPGYLPAAFPGVILGA